MSTPKQTAKQQEVVNTETWWQYDEIDECFESREYASSTGAFLIRADGRKDAKHSRYYDWFPTREQAVEHRRSQLEREVKSAEAELREAQKAFATFNRREKQEQK